MHWLKRLRYPRTDDYYSLQGVADGCSCAVFVVAAFNLRLLSTLSSSSPSAVAAAATAAAALVVVVVVALQVVVMLLSTCTCASKIETSCQVTPCHCYYLNWITQLSLTLR